MQKSKLYIGGKISAKENKNITTQLPVSLQLGFIVSNKYYNSSRSFIDFPHFDKSTPS